MEEAENFNRSHGRTEPQQEDNIIKAGSSEIEISNKGS